jgi:hypothetical protein
VKILIILRKSLINRYITWACLKVGAGLYRISREVELSVLNQLIELRIVSKQFKNSLIYGAYKYIHQGMYIIRIKGMIGKKLGTKVLVTSLDKRRDMNENSLITYIAPDLMMSVQ